jgi:hypothetical protein
MRPSPAVVAAYAATVWEWRCGGVWLPMPRRLHGSWAAVSAMNPRSLRLSHTANRHRDALLGRLAPGAMRVRGRARDGSWCELGRLVPHRPGATRAWLRDLHQWAAQVWDRRGSRLWWIFSGDP